MTAVGIEEKFKAEGRCRLCLRSSSVRKLTKHRVVPGSAGGGYRAVNVVPLCRPCHDLVDGRDPAEKRAARRMLRASLWPVEHAHASRWRHFPADPLGRRWSFDRAYPVPPRELVLARRAALSA